MQLFKIREGLDSYYKSELEHSQVNINNISRLSDGWKTATYKFQLEYVSEEEGKVSKLLILKMYPGNDGVELAENEFNILSSLMMTTVDVPDVYRLEKHPSVIEIPFIIMEYLPGPLLINYIRDNEDQQEELLNKFSKTLADLHSLEWKTFVIEPDRFKVSDPYQYLAIELNQIKDKIEIHDKKEFIPVLRWLVENMDTVPNDKLSLIHNDFHLANVMVDERDEGLFVIDWVDATIGDFRADLAQTLVVHETVISKQIRDIIYNSYRNFFSYEIEEIKYFEVLACLNQLVDFAININFGSEAARLNPSRVDKMKEDLTPIKNILRLLYGHTRVKLPDIEQMISM